MSTNDEINEEIIDEVVEEEIVDESNVNEDEDINFDDDNDEVVEEEIIDNEKEELFEQKYIRLLAEFDNYKKRTAKESMSSQQFGKIKVFEKLVDSIDTLGKAVEQISEENDFTKGVKMTYDNLLRNMSELGLKETDYSTFDPNYHMAVVTDSVEDKEDDEILEVLQKGYVVEDRLVRQAMVKVNKK